MCIENYSCVWMCSLIYRIWKTGLLKYVNNLNIQEMCTQICKSSLFGCVCVCVCKRFCNMRCLKSPSAVRSIRSCKKLKKCVVCKVFNNNKAICTLLFLLLVYNSHTESFTQVKTFHCSFNLFWWSMYAQTVILHSHEPLVSHLNRFF